jgi:hypothetical protein
MSEEEGDDFIPEEEEKKLKRQRANMLPADLDIGVVKIQAKMETGRHATVLWLLNEALFKEGVISPEAYRLLAQRYSRKLVDVVRERGKKRENSNVSVLSLEKQKELEKLKDKDNQLKGMLSQWDIHTDISWREKAVAFAEKLADKRQRIDSQREARA